MPKVWAGVGRATNGPYSYPKGSESAYNRSGGLWASTTNDRPRIQVLRPMILDSFPQIAQSLIRPVRRHLVADGLIYFYSQLVLLVLPVGSLFAAADLRIPTTALRRSEP